MLVFLVCHNSTPSASVPLTLLSPHEQNATQPRLAAGIDSAIEARDLSGQSHVCAKTPSRPERGTNPDSAGDEPHKAGSPRSRWSSAPFPWDPRHSCGPLRQRSPRRSRGNERGREASESTPDTPGCDPDLAAAAASCVPVFAVSAAGRAVTAHSGVIGTRLLSTFTSVFHRWANAQPGTAEGASARSVLDPVPTPGGSAPPFR